MFGTLSVKDANRERVIIVLDRLLARQKHPLCACPACVSAIAAAALNCVPPHYYVDKKWEAQVGSPWVLIEAVVSDAIQERGKQPGGCKFICAT